MSNFTFLLLRTLFIYFMVLFIMRIMGKREIGKLSVFDFVVSIMIADFAVLPIEDPDLPLFEGIFPMLVMISAQIIIAYISLKSPFLRHLIDGKPTIVIKDGNILEKEMRKQRYNIDDLHLQLRERNIFNVADVELAMLETTGKLSVFPKAAMEQRDRSKGKEIIPLSLIVDGKIEDGALQKIGQNRLWLKKEVEKYGYQLKEVFFASIDYRGRIYVDPWEEKK